MIPGIANCMCVSIDMLYFPNDSRIEVILGKATVTEIRYQVLILDLLVFILLHVPALNRLNT